MVTKKTTARYAAEQLQDDENKTRHQPSVNNSLRIKPDHLKTFDPLTENQRLFFEMYKGGAYFMGLFGSPGVGKTFLALYKALEEVLDKSNSFKQAVVVRSLVQLRDVGFLPGDLKDKLDPYMQPLYDALRDMIPYEKLESHLEKGIIQIAPLAFMRGRTLDNAFVILDEAQNTTHNQMKMFLTRMGKSARFIINGDPGQIDLPRRQISGLKEAILTLKDVKGIAFIYFDDKDVIRHKLVKEIISAYKNLEVGNE